MSVTTTDNARITSLRHALADYDLVLSQPDDDRAARAPPPDAHPLPANAPSSNPAGWEDQWRRVPAYRPMNNQLDDQREVYSNEIEHNFIRVMFGGVWMMSTASHLWRATGGKINSEYFKLKVGGEW
ncbi:hypothetical protein LTR78_002695 [Recurvomyces mirabilis]|uniref:Uncharacterized protein n=1 Tax=Recurvomyces mirabilis TaxID=574656 RepID=A0AAE0WSR7_9PEZI|nr:hypothetical protein LTR78_002695 [Recurvomyces mirabilis]KAK5159570.1 hypothetical protein LTS14_002712 [Recurvomyces mirabilis]